MPMYTCLKNHNGYIITHIDNYYGVFNDNYNYYTCQAEMYKSWAIAAGNGITIETSGGYSGMNIDIEIFTTTNTIQVKLYSGVIYTTYTSTGGCSIEVVAL